MSSAFHLADDTPRSMLQRIFQIIRLDVFDQSREHSSNTNTLLMITRNAIRTLRHVNLELDFQRHLCTYHPSFCNTLKQLTQVITTQSVHTNSRTFDYYIYSYIIWVLFRSTAGGECVVTDGGSL